MGSQTSLKTSQGGGGCNPLNPPPRSASESVFVRDITEVLAYLAVNPVNVCIHI